MVSNYAIKIHRVLHKESSGSASIPIGNTVLAWHAFSATRKYAVVCRGTKIIIAVNH
uniref:Aspartic proteinase Asp1 n=1 Tax=Rhizophora mucronata TaxID=61149 RepID=A0A2P2KCD4_RHIMU